jgi:hypothetical protein
MALDMSLLSLPPGTQVGAWRVLGFRGRGIYGTVYAAQRTDREQPGLAALKLAIYPDDPRFEREAELLARIRHPSVPRLIDAGLWQAPSGRSHPFDVFALGVTAYRLVTDTYPPFTDPHTPEGQLWLPGGRGPTPPRQLNPRVDAQLNALILRMLSPRPGERGAGGELAEAMERGVAHAVPSADTPLFEWETQEPSEWTEEERAQARELGHRPRRRDRERVGESEQADASARVVLARRTAEAWTRAAAPAKQVKARTWLTWLAAAMALGLWPGKPGSLRSKAPLTAASGGSTEEGDPVALGDRSTSSSEVPTKVPAENVVAQELPFQPLPGQLKPDSKGRCLKKQIAINGGCWRKVDLDPDECPGNGVMYQGGCYVPIFTSERQPASGPQKSAP